MPLYIAKSGDLDRCYRCLTDWLTDSQRKDRATQLLKKYKSGALLTQQKMLLEMALVLVWWLFVVGVTLDHDEDDVDDDGDGKGMVGNDRVGCLWTHTSPASRALSRPRICIYSTPISWNAQKFDAASFSTKLGQSGMADQFAILTSDYLDSSCTESLVMVIQRSDWSNWKWPGFLWCEVFDVWWWWRRWMIEEE